MSSQRITAERAAPTAQPGHWPRLRALGLLAAALALAGGGGCATLWPSKTSTSKAPPTPGPADGMVLRGGDLEKEVQPEAGTPAAELEGAKRLYQEGNHAKAERVFAKIANNTKNTVVLAEEAMYYQGDCFRLQGRYPKAAEVYNQMLNTFPMGKHGNEARQRLFDIANYWLDDTRAYMEACKEKKEGKRSWIWPSAYMRFDKTKPLFDEEGHAVRMLEQVYITDPTGPLAEKALFYLGSVKFFREDYREADHYFDQLRQHHPNGTLAPKSVEMSIICKQMSTGGSDYDGRLVSEARDLVNVAYTSYPELANNRSQFLKDQLYSIAQQQADKDFNIAEFYRRVGRPGSAYFQYEFVRRRYPGTQYAQKAGERMNELRGKLEKSRARQEAPAVSGPSNRGAEIGPAPRQYTPGAPLETAPAPNVLPPSMSNDRR